MVEHPRAADTSSGTSRQGAAVQHIQPALPLIHRDGERITIPHMTPIVATTDPAKPPHAFSTSTGPVVAIVPQPDGTEWVWWQGKGGYLKAAVLIDGALPAIDRPPPVPRVRPSRWCERCGEQVPEGKSARYCSSGCRSLAKRSKRAARRATKPVCRVGGCRRRGCQKHHPTSYRGRARYWGVPYESFLNSDVYDRDKWTCGICGGSVDQHLRWPDPMSVSLDHVLPMSRGGGHLWANVQCSHLLCNMRKHARILPALDVNHKEPGDAA